MFVTLKPGYIRKFDRIPSANRDAQIALNNSFISIKKEAMALSYTGNFAPVRDESLLREAID